MNKDTTMTQTILRKSKYPENKPAKEGHYLTPLGYIYFDIFLNQFTTGSGSTQVYELKPSFWWEEVPVSGVTDEEIQDEDLLKGIDINNLLERAKWYVADQNGFDSWGALLQYYEEQADEIDPEEESTLENIIDDVSCKYGYDLAQIVSKLAITGNTNSESKFIEIKCVHCGRKNHIDNPGNKPLKTEEEIKVIMLDLANWIVRDKFYDIPDFQNNNYSDDHGYLIWPNIIDWYYTNIFNNSTPIVTLDKEELLKQAKENVAKDRGFDSWDHLEIAFTSRMMHRLLDADFYQAKNHLVESFNQVAEEYLRLCTGKE